MDKMLLTSIIFLMSGTSSFAAIVELSPTMVIVDTDTGVVLREPKQLDYDYLLMDKKIENVDLSNKLKYSIIDKETETADRRLELENAIKDKETKDANRSWFSRIFKKCGAK